MLAVFVDLFAKEQYLHVKQLFILQVRAMAVFTGKLISFTTVATLYDTTSEQDTPARCSCKILLLDYKYEYRTKTICGGRNIIIFYQWRTHYVYKYCTVITTSKIQ